MHLSSFPEMGACRPDFVFNDLLFVFGIDLNRHPQQDLSSVLCMLTIVVWEQPPRGDSRDWHHWHTAAAGLPRAAVGFGLSPDSKPAVPATLQHPINFPHRPFGCQDWKELSSTITTGSHFK